MATMSLNENILEGKWLEMRGAIQKSWGRLTDDELDQTRGDLKSIEGLIQQKYGEAQEEYSKKLSKIASRFEKRKEEVLRGAKKALKH